MDPKPRRDHELYIQMLRRMTPGQRLAKTFDLSEFARRLFADGLRNRFPHLSEEDFQKLLRARLDKCHNRNY